VEILNQSEEYVTKLLTENLPKGCLFHNLRHTFEVYKSAKEIGKNSGLSKDQLNILLIAALFHDTGITQNYNFHEEKSVEICEKFLKQNNFSSNEIDHISKIIMVTKTPHNPETMLEKIICDADISHIGKRGYFFKLKLLRKEWEIMLYKQFSDTEWYSLNINFLNENYFFTEYAKITFEKGKESNLKKLEAMLKKTRAE